MENTFEREPKAFIKHYYTKTVEEFCNKIKKGHAHFHKNHSQYLKSIQQRVNFFFRLNIKTKEKLYIIKKCTNIKFDN